MNEVETYSKPGKAKHLAIGNGKIVGLYLNERNDDTKIGLPATIEIINEKTEDFNNTKHSTPKSRLSLMMARM